MPKGDKIAKKSSQPQELVLRKFIPREGELPVVFSFSKSGCLLPSKITKPAPQGYVCSSTDRLIDACSYGVSVFRPIFSSSWVDLTMPPLDVRTARRRNSAIPMMNAFERKLNFETSQSILKIRNRLDLFYWPYYNAMNDRLIELRSKYKNVLILDIHVLNQQTGAADVVLRKNLQETANTNVFNAVFNILTDHPDFKVKKSDFKVGSHILDYFGRPADGLHAVQMGISLKALEDEIYVNEYHETKIQRAFREMCFFAAGHLKVW